MKRLLLLAALLGCLFWSVDSPVAAPNYAGFGGATSPEYDVIVDLAHPEYLLTDNACDAFAAAVRPWISGGATGNYSVLVHGTGTVEYSDFYDTGDFQRCFAICKSDTFEAGTDQPTCEVAAGGSMHGGKLHVHFESAKVITDMDPAVGIQTEPSIVFMVGGGYEYGFTGAGEEAYDTALGPGLQITGNLRWAPSDIVEESAFETTDEFPSPPYTTGNANASDLTTIGMMTVGLTGVDMSQFYYEVLPTYATRDDDDIGLVSLSSNGLKAGTLSIFGTGVGAVVYGPNNGDWWSGYISNNHFGLMLGDPVIGGNVAATTNCNDPGGECAVRDSQVRQFQPRSTLLIESNVFDFWSWDVHWANFDKMAVEHSAASTEVSICIGAGRDSTDGNEPCCVDADSTTGGADGCIPATGVGTDSNYIGVIDYGEGKPISDASNVSVKDLAFGPNFKWPGNEYQSRVDMRRTPFTDTSLTFGGTTNALFGYDDDTAAGYVILDNANWRYGSNLPPAGYDNISFPGAPTIIVGLMDDSLGGGHVGDYCLSSTLGDTGPTQCNALENNLIMRANFPFVTDAYIHNCSIFYSSTGSPAGTAGLGAGMIEDNNDVLQLQMRVADHSDNDIVDAGNIYYIRDANDSCAAEAPNCTNDYGVFNWEVRARASVAQGHAVNDGGIQVEIANGSVDNGSNAPLRIRVVCPVSIP